MPVPVRRVRATVGLWATIGVLLLLAAVTVYAGRRSPGERAAFDRSVPIEATIVSSVAVGGGRAGGSSTDVRVRFLLGDVVHTATVRLHRALEAGHEGEPVTVRYDPQDPDRVFDPGDAPEGQVQTAGALVVGAVGALVLARRARRRGGARR